MAAWIKPQISSHRPYHIVQCYADSRISIALACSMVRDDEPIAQLRYWLKVQYTTYKALPVLMCTKNTALRDVSQDKYSTRLRLVLYLSLNTPPHVVFSIQTCGSALSNM